MGHFECLEMMGGGIHHISVACLGRRLGKSTTRVRRRQGTWVVFVQRDSVDQELIKVFVDY